MFLKLNVSEKWAVAYHRRNANFDCFIQDCMNLFNELNSLKGGYNWTNYGVKSIKSFLEKLLSLLA